MDRGVERDVGCERVAGGAVEPDLPGGAADDAAARAESQVERNPGGPGGGGDGEPDAARSGRTARADRAARLTRARQGAFLGVLRETSDVPASARSIGVSLSALYRERARDPRFAEAWAQVVAEGREALATELLARARGVTGPDGASPDVKLGLDLLKHMASDAARGRAVPDTVPAYVPLERVQDELLRRLEVLSRRLGEAM